MIEDQLIRDISPNDEMYATDQPGSDFYWVVGRSAIECISLCLAAAGKQPSGVTRILDFPCGHGRVTRYLKLAFPQAEITACDLLKDGVDFCASTFGAVPVYSHQDPSQVALSPKSFDLIWVGSLFTHLDASRWNGFLKLFASSLRDDGLLVFSAHGRLVYSRLKGSTSSFDYGVPFWRKTLLCASYERTGAGYADYPTLPGYGLSLSDPSWVCDQIRQLPQLTMTLFSASGWHDTHDIYGCRKLADDQIIPPTSRNRYWANKMRDLTPTGLVQLLRKVGLPALRR